MPRIEQKPQQFQPVLVTLETQSEFDAFRALLELARTSDRIVPASPEELFVTQLSEQLDVGIKVSV